MAEVLTGLAIYRTQIAARQSGHGGDCASTILRVCDSHEELRARLENAEQERDEARAVLREARGYVDLCAIRAGRNVSASTTDLLRRIAATLGAAGEREGR